MNREWERERDGHEAKTQGQTGRKRGREGGRGKGSRRQKQRHQGELEAHERIATTTINASSLAVNRGKLGFILQKIKLASGK